MGPVPAHITHLFNLRSPNQIIQAGHFAVRPLVASLFVRPVVGKISTFHIPEED